MPISQSLDFSGWRPWGLLCCFAVLLAVEGVSRTDWVWSSVSRSATGIVDVVERQIIDPAETPIIIVLGNSRGRDAILPAVVERELGLPERTVLNLSITDGDPFDAYRLYRDHRDKLGQARIMVLCFDDFQMGSYRYGTPTERYRRYADLGQRVRDFKGVNRNSLVAGWVWRTLDVSQSLERVVKRGFRSMGDTVHIDEDRRVVWRTTELDQGPETANSLKQAKAYYGEPSAIKDDWRMKYLRSLIRSAQTDGLRVVIYRTAWRASFDAERLRLYPEAEERFYRSMAALIDKPEQQILFQRSAASVGLRDTDFLDYGHATKNGARLLSRKLAEHLGPILLDVKPSSLTPNASTMPPIAPPAQPED